MWYNVNLNYDYNYIYYIVTYRGVIGYFVDGVIGFAQHDVDCRIPELFIAKTIILLFDTLGIMA